MIYVYAIQNICIPLCFFSPPVTCYAVITHFYFLGLRNQTILPLYDDLSRLTLALAIVLGVFILQDVTKLRFRESTVPR